MFEHLAPRTDYKTLEELQEHFAQVKVELLEDSSQIESLVLMAVEVHLAQLSDVLDKQVEADPSKTRESIFQEEIMPIWIKQVEQLQASRETEEETDEDMGVDWTE